MAEVNSPGGAVAPLLLAPDPRRWLALVAALTAPFLGVVDFFIVNLALPQIHDKLGASFAQQELVIAFYGLAYAVFVVTGGRMGDTHGRKRMFLVGLAGFVLASILCGIAPDPVFLLGARLFQGFTAALAFPQVLALIQVSFPEHERPKALAYFGLTVGLASIAGQLLGGHLIEWNPFGWGWRTLFLINVPVGGVALAMAARTLRETRADDPPTLDLSGVFIATLGLVMFLLPLVLGPQLHWPAWVIATFVGSFPVLWLFWRHEMSAAAHGRDPLIDPTLFGLPTFRRGLAMIYAYFAGGGSFFLVLSLYEQNGLHMSTLEAANSFTPFAVALLCSSLFAARHVTTRRGTFLAIGMSFMVSALAVLVVTLATTSTGDAHVMIWVALSIYGFGQGFLSPVLFSTAVSGVPLRSAGAASGVISTAQQVSSSLGVGVIGLVFSTALAGGTGPHATAHAAAWALGVNLLTMSTAAVLAMRLPRIGGPTPAGPVEM
jgi:EmrB/QacA subfamily drug resistance transporter